MFGKGIYLSVFYCLCYVTYISTYISEEQLAEERDMDVNEEEDIRLDEIRKDYWVYVAEEGKDKKNIHALRWEVCVKSKEDLIKKEFWCQFHILKGGKCFGFV